jgi:hypothetical protein
MPTNPFTPTPHEWQTYRRLSAAGFPIDWNSLHEPCFPLRVRQEPAALGTEILPIPGGTALVCRLSILAAVRFRLTEISLQANWSPSSLQRPEFCDLHHQSCFHNCCKGDVRLDPAGMLTNLFHRPLNRGEEVKGYLAVMRGVVPASAGQKLELTLHLRDELHRSYPYGLSLDNSQCIAGNGDEYCRFHSAAQIQAEIERRETEKRIAEQRAARPPAPARELDLDRIFAGVL